MYTTWKAPIAVPKTHERDGIPSDLKYSFRHKGLEIIAFFLFVTDVIMQV